MKTNQNGKAMNLNEIKLRNAVQEDFDFLYDLHKEALKDYIEVTWGWDEEWQQDYFQKKFDISERRIIQYQGNDIGCVTVRDEGSYLFLGYIAILPKFQNMGIGTVLVQQVIENAAQRDISVRLHVLRSNPARRLYERLGFIIIDETETKYIMEKSS